MSSSLLDDTSAAPTPLAPPGAEAASKLYPTRPLHVLEAPRSAEIQTIRDSRAASSGGFYSAENSYGKTYDAKGNQIGLVRELALAAYPRASDGELDKLVPELAVIAADAGMNRDDLGMLASAVSSALKDPKTGEPLSKAQVEAKQLQVISAIRESTATGGAGAFDRAFADAKAVAMRDPRLKQILDKSGAFNDVRVAMRFVELGKAARSRGELN